MLHLSLTASLTSRWILSRKREKGLLNCIVVTKPSNSKSEIYLLCWCDLNVNKWPLSYKADLNSESIFKLHILQAVKYLLGLIIYRCLSNFQPRYSYKYVWGLVKTNVQIINYLKIENLKLCKMKTSDY